LGANSAFQLNTFGSSSTRYINGGFIIGKKLWNKQLDLNLNTNFALTAQFLESNPIAEGSLTNMMFSAGWKIADKSTITLYSGYIHNNVKNSTTGKKRFSEFRSSLNYQYRFITKRQK
jgi:hypothetical protein